jgi:hypothetical protein
VLLELLQDLVLHLHRDRLEIGDGLRDLLDLVVGEVLHHLAAGLLPEGDKEDAHLRRCRQLGLLRLLLLGPWAALPR